jgi:tetratricopeptide (TPR) repeat protein
VSVAALLALTLVTSRQIGYWGSDIALWTHSAEVSPGNWKAEYLSGMALDADGQHQAAIGHYFRAAAINPTDPFNNLNIAQYEQNHANYAMAIDYYKKVLPQAWNAEQRATVLTNMAASYRMLGDTASADACLAKIRTLPQKTMDWQGAWWKNILPMIREYLHGGAAKPQN